MPNSPYFTITTTLTDPQSTNSRDKLETKVSPAFSSLETVIRGECDKEEDDMKATDTETQKPVHTQILWVNAILLGYLHMAAVYGFYLMFTSAKWQTNLFAYVLYLSSGMGVTAGAHRLWAHRSYKARFPLRVLLAFLFTMTCENDIFDWVRKHRGHHKYSETDADPHNAKRGFFFSHVGWLCCKSHPEVIKKGKNVDVSDLMADPIVRFQRKYYLWLVLLCAFLWTTIFPMYFWGETFCNAFFVATLFRICFTYNATWLVNSAAHLWGNRPYDVNINPSENLFVVLAAVGEGFHNYHHTFPYDYATSEYGIKYNVTTGLIDTMAYLGLAYDRKTASRSLVRTRKLRTGQPSVLSCSKDSKEE